MSGGGFAGLTVQAARRALAARLRDDGIESPDLDARLLVGAALRLDLTGLAVQAERRVTADEAAAIEGFARRRIAGWLSQAGVRQPAVPNRAGVG